MKCDHGHLTVNGLQLRIYGGKWPASTQDKLTYRQFCALYLWHWDHMQCVYRSPEDYTLRWWDWYEALKAMCLDYEFRVPASINVIGLGK